MASNSLQALLQIIVIVSVIATSIFAIKTEPSGFLRKRDIRGPSGKEISQNPKQYETCQAYAVCRSIVNHKIHKTSTICGTDGQLYFTQEEFLCVKKWCNIDLKALPVSKCPTNSVPLNSLPMLAETSRKIRCNPDECGCPDTFQPLCGTDGITYGNLCLMNCNKKCSPKVSFFYTGYCGRIIFVNPKSPLFLLHPQFSKIQMSNKTE